MKEPVDYRILHKFALGKYSLKDFRLISRWFEDKNNEEDLKLAIQQHWSEFSEDFAGNEKDLTSVLNQLKQKIAKERPVVHFRKRIQKFYTRAAAILLLPLLLYSVYATFQKVPAPEISALVEIVSPNGARTHFRLPDGSQGWLNSGSALKYKTDFLEKRTVQLLGEAWFEVAPDEESPFVVETPHLDVQVLGTKFNIAAFPDEKVTEVVLQEGKVKVNGYNGTFTFDMKPDEKFTYNKELQSGTIQTVNADQFSSWKDGLLVFRNEPLSEVLKRIGRWYNVEFVLTDPEIAKFRYRATFHEEQIEEVIRLISLTAPIKYSFNKREMSNDGVFKKRKITIQRKI
jgi:ferric-dicitrate binding protein FerR (iron transport regulator)